MIRNWYQLHARFDTIETSFVFRFCKNKELVSFLGETAVTRKQLRPPNKGGKKTQTDQNFRPVCIIDVSCGVAGVAGVAKMAGKVNKQKNLNKSLSLL